MQKFDAEFEALAVRLYRRLRSSSKVASRLQIGSSSVWRILDRNGVKLPARGSEQAHAGIIRFKGKSAAAVVAAYLAGEPMKALRRKYRCSDGAIRNAVTRAGGEIRPEGGVNRARKWTAAEKDEICQLYTNGWTQTQIAIRFRTNQPKVSKILISAGAAVREQFARGERHGSWNGGKHVLDGGYVGILVDRSDPLFCMARANHYVPEHRLVVARSLNRPLTRRESVHHINGNVKDNRLENLQLRQGKHGTGTIARCADCGSHNIVHASIRDAA